MRLLASSISARRSGVRATADATFWPFWSIVSPGLFPIGSTLGRRTTPTCGNSARLRNCRGRGCVLPKTKATLERVGVVSGPAFGWHGFQELHISAAQHNVIRFQSRGQLLNYVGHVAPPFLLAKSLHATQTYIVFIGALAVREMGQLHGKQRAIDNHR